MAAERLERILAELSGRCRRRVRGASVRGRPRRWWDVSGAGIMLMSGDVPAGSLATTNEVSTLIEELQYAFGEGPCVDAYHQDRVVHEADLADPAIGRWLAFTPPALAAGVASGVRVPAAGRRGTPGCAQLVPGSTWPAERVSSTPTRWRWPTSWPGGCWRCRLTPRRTLWPTSWSSAPISLHRAERGGHGCGPVGRHGQRSAHSHPSPSLSTRERPLGDVARGYRGAKPCDSSDRSDLRLASVPGVQCQAVSPETRRARNSDRREEEG